ncbi:MAG: DUF490 domain-containing protein, partial [Paracoccus sp. (in: a-proteobacteria)]|nr:DUF490 domain-containing protein [Paracoccus sp. (in: a-proteobacteria)]
MKGFWISVAALLFPLVLLAQTAAELSEQIRDDRGFLTSLLERSLSDAGRTVVIDGFRGALSSRATFTEMRIADADGVWLTLRDGALQWNRSALLRRRIEIAELTAAQIILPRLPQGDGTQPQIEAEVPSFSLPELPVAVNIEQIRADRVELGQPVIGVPAVLRVDGTLSLEAGEGATQLSVSRLDGPRGEFVLDSAYSNQTRILRLNLGLDEAADGLLANLIDLYERPALQAQISGEGELSDFAADIRLATNGQSRITGRVAIAERRNADGALGTGFDLRIGGDIASLLRPQDRAFFGQQAQLEASGWRAETGRIQIPTLSLQTEALRLSGSLSTNDDNAPEEVRLQILLGRDAGAPQLPVALPFADIGTTVDNGRLDLSYDADQGQGWTLQGRVGQVDRGDLMLGELLLDGAGEVVLEQGALAEVIGAMDFGTRDMAFADPGLARAIGSRLDGQARFNFTPGNVLDLHDVTVSGADFSFQSDFLVAGLSSGLNISVQSTARHDDLSRLSLLAGRDLTGQAQADLSGYYVVLNRAFDLDARISASDLTVDQAQIDRLLGGRSEIVAELRRDETGLEVEMLTVETDRLSASASGRVTSLSSDLVAQLSMPSLAEADPDFGGSLQAEARLNGPVGARRVTLSGEATDLRIGIAALDDVLSGRTNLTAIAAEVDDGFALDSFQLSNPQLNASAEGRFADGALDAVARVTVPSMAALNADWNGRLEAEAQLSQDGPRRVIDLTGTGQNLAFGQGAAGGALTGRTLLRVLADEEDGVLTLRDVQVTNDQLRATAQGVLGDGVTDLTAALDIATLAPFGPGWRGALRADAVFRQANDGIRRLEVVGSGRDRALGQAQVDGALAGETRLAMKGTETDGVLTIQSASIDNPRLQATASGTLGAGVTDVTAELAASDLRFLGNGIAGALRAQGRVVQEN